MISGHKLRQPVRSNCLDNAGKMLPRNPKKKEPKIYPGEKKKKMYIWKQKSQEIEKGSDDPTKEGRSEKGEDRGGGKGEGELHWEDLGLPE